ncbi:unnamed protein product [Prunus armeniaca]|uniref:Amidase domain-containing protein n=1 Tax=Prunus armeniaca TaxID=36596 RepID=A0A6J5UR62_PRUAR|nr:unnamed protein product [Prunus armeniaca]
MTSRKLVELNSVLHVVIEVNPCALYQANKAGYQGKAKAPSYYYGLHGIPILLKDNIGTKDKLNTIDLLGLVVPQDANIVCKLREVRAIILWKASL